MDDAEHELAADWHQREIAPEVVLLVSLGTLMLLGMATQLMRQNTALVLPLIIMGAVTLGSLLMWQNTLREHLYVARP